MEYIWNNVEKGVFRSQIPIRSINMFESSFIDGIAQSVATSAAEGNDNSEDISVMFETLAKAIVGFLEGVKND